MWLRGEVIVHQNAKKYPSCTESGIAWANENMKPFLLRHAVILPVFFSERINFQIIITIINLR